MTAPSRTWPARSRYGRMPPEPGPAPRFGEAVSEALDRCREVLAAAQPPTAAGSWTKQNVFGQPEPVTAADIAVQEILARACASAFPGIPVVAEENRPHLGDIPGTCVIIDPIDGTVPFLNGSPVYTIAACLIEAGYPAQAVVDFPAYAVRVLAEAGHGVQVRGPGHLPAFGPSSLLASPAQATAVRDAARDTGTWTVTPVPTTSAKMVLVALARADAAVRVRAAAPGVAPWDYAAAALIVQEAGGIVRDDQDRNLARSAPSPVNGWLACRGPELAGPLRQIMTGSAAQPAKGDTGAL